MIFQWNSAWFFSALLCVFNRLIAREKFRRSSNAITLLLLSLLCFSAPVWSADGTKLQKLRSATPREFTISNRQTVFDRRV